MVAYTKPQQWKREEIEWLRGERERERDQIKFIDLRFERWHVVGSGMQGRGKTFHKLHVLRMNDELWDRIRRLGSETWKGCE